MNWNVDNCPRCGRLFAKNFKNICPSCIREIEQEYEKCSRYLREHRGATVMELSEATGVSVRQITRFIREGRISLADHPGIDYPCDLCGNPIREGTLCAGCRARLSRDLEQLKEREAQAKPSERDGRPETFRIKEQRNQRP